MPCDVSDTGGTVKRKGGHPVVTPLSPSLSPCSVHETWAGRHSEEGTWATIGPHGHGVSRLNG